MKTTVVNKRQVAPYINDVYIGRGSKWGNPFIIGRDGSRDDVCEKYIAYMTAKIKAYPAIFNINELKGKRLVCYCKPLRCHGDWLAALANGEVIL